MMLYVPLCSLTVYQLGIFFFSTARMSNADTLSDVMLPQEVPLPTAADGMTFTSKEVDEVVRIAIYRTKYELYVERMLKRKAVHAWSRMLISILSMSVIANVVMLVMLIQSRIIQHSHET